MKAASADVAPEQAAAGAEIRRRGNRIGETAGVPQILIIGYGNVLREDDGAGYRAAEELQQNYRNDPAVTVIASHQLLPEMAPDIARSGLVVFLDASSAEEPGKISQSRIQPQACGAGFTHQLTPAALLSLAERLYGHAPDAVGITLAGWSFNVRDKLSRRAEMLLPVLIAQARSVVESHRQWKSRPGPA
jgi:hydrogenase maturation protease